MPQSVTYHDLAGGRVFMTGGGSGIGAALVDAFLGQGAEVVFVQRSDASAFCDEMEAKHGRRPHYIPCDIADIDALQGAMAEGKARIGPYSVLVNNAAHDQRQQLADIDPAEWDRMQNVNLRPHFFTAQAAAPDMIAAGKGAIVNVSSIAYMMGGGDFHAYVAAKAGVTGLTRGLARELGPKGIRVNALMPGWVLTDRQMRLWAEPDSLAAHLDRQCLKEHLSPRDMADPVLFLASDASRMMTGQALVVDGGVVTTG